LHLLPPLKAIFLASIFAVSGCASQQHPVYCAVAAIIVGSIAAIAEHHHDQQQRPFNPQCQSAVIGRNYDLPMSGLWSRLLGWLGFQDRPSDRLRCPNTRMTRTGGLFELIFAITPLL
jgi:hypothetical protein